MENQSRDPVYEAFITGGPAPEFLLGTSQRRKRIYKSSRPIEQPVPIQEFQGTEYAKAFQDEEMNSYVEAQQSFREIEQPAIYGSEMSMLELSSVGPSECFQSPEAEKLQQKRRVYAEYDFSQSSNPSLAIAEKRELINSMLKGDDVLIIKGFTGCGKTTQVPQFILDDHAREGKPCNIVVTQPRRIAAVSIAKRVCQERKWPLGSVVGYQIGMDHKTSDYTCLTYMTTGCLLESIVSRKGLDAYTHIIIDEVHERDEDTDLLLLVVRKLLRTTKTNTKVILMSATVNAEKFAEYLKVPFMDTFQPAVTITVDSVRHFSVSVFYLDDLQKVECLGPFIPGTEPDEPSIDPNLYQAAARLIAALDKHREIGRYGPAREGSSHSMSRGAVLIFLPGLAEIEQMHKALLNLENNYEDNEPLLWHVLPLHSRVTSEEQNNVFQPPPSGYRKIILATNIAESSITVPDTIYVIDFCLMKQLVADIDTNFCSLKVEWAPKANCTQRKGRVGRVVDGVVYRMVTRKFYESQLPEEITPEILRCPLEHAVLRTKLLDLGEPRALLALALDPPNLTNIVKTIATLKEVGALLLTAEGTFTMYDGDLSYLGRVISKLPIDVHLGKLVMLGYVFNVLEECIIMAAGLSSKNIFTSPYQQKLLAYQVKLSWAEGSFSDPITILNAYQVWIALKRSEHFKRSGQTERERESDWARRQFLQLRALKEMDLLVHEIKGRLKDIGIEPPCGPNIVPLTDTQKALILRVVLFGAFYPQYFSREAIVDGKIDERQREVETREREIVNSLCGFDPFCTVKLGGFPYNQPAKVYAKQIKDNLTDIFRMLQEDTWSAKISFETSRVFIQFHQEGNPSRKKGLPGRIVLPVYLALKKRQIREYFTIHLLDNDLAALYSQQIEESAKRLLGETSANKSSASTSGDEGDVPHFLQLPAARFPRENEEIISVAISHIEEPNRFWVQRIEPQTSNDYRKICSVTDGGGRNLIPLNSYNSIRKGSLVMGPYREPGLPEEYYRAKILSTQTNVPSASRKVRLYFIDFGNAAEAYITTLRKIPEELIQIPPLAFECVLTGIGPSLVRNPLGKWTLEAMNWIRSSTKDKKFHAKIFSIVNGILHIDLLSSTLPPEENNWEHSIRNQLISMKFGVEVEESFCSKENHKERKQAQRSGHLSVPHLNERKVSQQRTVAAELAAMEYHAPQIDARQQTLTLRGPFSPLEMKMYGKVKALSGFTVFVENDSVNSVLLDDQPQDCHEKILIACQVGMNPNGDRVVVRNTTLLPDIHGLPALLTLIFAPRAELRADKSMKQLTGAICGLGCFPEQNKSIYPEHDMEIIFDTEIDLDDIVQINKIRYWINTVFGIPSFSGFHSAPSREKMIDVSKKIVNFFFELTSKQRVQITNSERSPHPHKWNIYPAENILKADIEKKQLQSLLPLIDGITLRPKNS